MLQVRRYQRICEEFMHRHAGQVALLASLFVIGVVFGALAVRGVSPRDKAEIVSYLGDAIPQMVRPQASEGGLLLKHALLRSFEMLAFLWVCGISLVGVVCIMAGAWVLGFVSGFLVAFMTAEMGWPGLALAVAGHLPHTLIQIPALTLCAAAATAFSLQVIRSWRERRRVPNFYPALGRFTGTVLATGVLLVLAGFVESYLSPALVRMVASLLHLT